ncbi:hypothetical protein [Spirosoma sordidisoli]|nr:hypothetical protein [Spirosoma sordidisoli]
MSTKKLRFNSIDTYNGYQLAGQQKRLFIGAGYLDQIQKTDQGLA